MGRGITGLSLLAISCQFARPPDVQPDAGPDAPPDAPTDARPDVVQGRSTFRHVFGDQAVDIPFDLTVLTVQALIPNGSAFATAAGVAHADGTFEIDNVQPGVQYLLRLGRSYYVTDQHALDFHTIIPARAGVATATQPTAVTFQIAGTADFQAGDQLIAASQSADAQAWLTTNIGQASTLATVDWMTSATATFGGVGHIPSPAADDDFWVLRYRTNQAQGTYASTIIEATDISSAALQDGQAATISATLAAPARSLTLPDAISLMPYAIGHSAFTRADSAGVECAAVRARTTYRGADGGVLGGLSIMTLAHQPPIPATLDLSAPVGDPFPQDWTRFCVIRHRRTRALRVPGTTIAWKMGSGTERVAEPHAVVGTPIQPPTSIRVSGQDGDRGGLLRNNGAPVVISWTGTAQATQYNVTVYQLRAQGGATRVTLLATVTTPAPTLTIPVELLAGSDFLTFTVSAISATNAYASGALFPEGVPGGSASATTAMFRWSATCGDGVPDVGEACDASAETAACDADCTAVQCGDGVRNVTAGELCDSIVDTPGCDSDCTANTCGDGYWNVETEQCDDGGTAPGDGCSATCTNE